MKKIILTNIFTILMVVFNGCSSSTYTMGNDFAKDDINKIIKGKTDIGELVELFGEPYIKTAMSDNAENWQYIYTTSTAKAEGFIFISIKSKTEQKSLNVLIKNNIVINYTFTNTNGKGLVITR